MWRSCEVDVDMDGDGKGMCEPPVDDPFGLQPPVAGPAESVDHDAHKPRATVAHCVATIGRKVVRHLEVLARAREEKHLRPYQTDAEIHEQHILATTGGGFNAGEAANTQRRRLDQARPL